GAAKDVRRVELSLEGAGLVVGPGEGMGVWPENRPESVNALLEVLALDGDAEVRVGGEALALRDALTQRLEITNASRGFAKAYAEVANAKALAALLETSDATAYLEVRQVVDVVAEHPAELTPQQFVNTLRKL